MAGVRKVEVYRVDDQELYVHFLYPDIDITFCEWQIGALEEKDLLFFHIKHLKESSKKKVDCPRCINLVEMIKGIKRSDFKRLTEMNED